MASPLTVRMLLAPAADARRLGKLVADDDTVRAPGELFAGPVPWINVWS